MRNSKVKILPKEVTKGKRRVGRPKKSVEDKVISELKKTNTILNDIRQMLDNMWRERRPQ